MLGMAQRRGFAGGADGDKPARPFADVPFDKFLERIQIQRAVAKRRDEGRQRAFKHMHAPYVLAGGKPDWMKAFAGGNV